MDNHKKEERSVGERVITSALWLGAWRWTARLIGLVSIIILGRLLLPDDFGVVATSMIVVVFFDILIDLGTDKYLIKLQAPDNEDYDTAWTLRLIVVAIAAGAACMLASPLAGYFGDDRLVDVIRLLALASLLRGFNNIGLTMYRRELQFGKIALIGLSQRLIGTITTIVLAFIWQNYWAMVVGQIALCLAELLFSYRFHPYRPQLQFSRFKVQWDFSKWFIVRNIATFFQSRGDQLVIAKYFGIEQIGLYAMAGRFAALPTTHLVAPMLPPIYSGLAKKVSEPALFRRGVLQVIGAKCALVLPAATLFAALGEPMVIGMLGEKWLAAVPFVAPLVFAIALGVLGEPAVTALTLRGRVKLLAALHWFSAVLLLGVMLATAILGDIEQLVVARVFLAAILLVVYYRWVCSELTVSWLSLLECVYRPILSCIVVWFLLVVISNASLEPWVILLFGLPVGGIVYSILLYVLWRIAASPDSGEALLICKFSTLAGRILRRFRK